MPIGPPVAPSQEPETPQPLSPSIMQLSQIQRQPPNQGFLFAAGLLVLCRETAGDQSMRRTSLTAFRVQERAACGLASSTGLLICM